VYQSTGNQYGRTSLRFNRSGTLAVQSPRRQFGTNVHQFDRNTGQFSTWLAIPWSPQFNDHYSAVFSPNDSLVYVSGWSSGSSTFNWVIQYDLTRSTPQEIADSVAILHFVSASSSIGQMQIAPDGKIYVAHENSSSLGVINSPNQPGQACNFVFPGHLCTSSTQFGLPNFVSQFTGPGPTTGCSPMVDIVQAYRGAEAQVYPNPLHREAWLEFNDPDGLGYQLIVVDMLGSVVISEATVHSPHRIVRQSLPDGVYSYVLLADKKAVATGRLVLR
jgi:hypothetical protein